ncbi:MAG: sigma-70 family RNA polymerase sigma factor [Planctomycetes bacterium]|jgi:RNA polymerase sigma-70 factor (ECF subfamily)|nr:sigma-70 family RNA polymerase sigma factor [Planctomycetota bacterium]
MLWFGSARPAIESLVESHYAALYRYAYRLSGAAQEAEDLTQETFCLAQTKLFQLREANRAKAWLFSILRNAYLHKVRTSKQEKQVSLDSIGEIPDRDSERLSDIDAAQLQNALDELPEAFKTPIILFYFEEFSYKEIAEQMDVPLGTVMSRLARAKAFLRQRLTDRAELVEMGTPKPQASPASGEGMRTEGL